MSEGLMNILLLAILLLARKSLVNGHCVTTFVGHSALRIGILLVLDDGGKGLFIWILYVRVPDIRTEPYECINVTLLLLWTE